jgi:hypothetical protein
MTANAGAAAAAAAVDAEKEWRIQSHICIIPKQYQMGRDLLLPPKIFDLYGVFY